LKNNIRVEDSSEEKTTSEEESDYYGSEEEAVFERKPIVNLKIGRLSTINENTKPSSQRKSLLENEASSKRMSK